jgi:hypothetical protein
VKAGRLATCFHSGIFLGLFYPEDEAMFLRNVGWLLNGLHDVIAQKILSSQSLPSQLNKTVFMKIIVFWISSRVDW